MGDGFAGLFDRLGVSSNRCVESRRYVIQVLPYGKATLKGYEMMNMLPQGQVIGVTKGDVQAQLNFMVQKLCTLGAT